MSFKIQDPANPVFPKILNDFGIRKIIVGHTLPETKENHLQKCFGNGYVSSQEDRFCCIFFKKFPIHLEGALPPPELPRVLAFLEVMALKKKQYEVLLEPQTTIYNWLFQLDDSQSLRRKWLFHQTSIYKWLFGVPGWYYLPENEHIICFLKIDGWKVLHFLQKKHGPF